MDDNKKGGIILIFGIVMSCILSDNAYADTFQNQNKNIDNMESTSIMHDIDENNKLINPLTTVYGNAGISKLWTSGGSIYYSVKMTNVIGYPTFNWTGILHVRFNNGKNRNWPVGGLGVGGKTWIGHRGYTKIGKHGHAWLTGKAVSINGRVASVAKPSTSF